MYIPEYLCNLAVNFSQSRIHENTLGFEDASAKEHLTALQGLVDKVLPLINPENRELKGLSIRCSRSLQNNAMATIHYGKNVNILEMPQLCLTKSLTDNEKADAKASLKQCNANYSLQHVSQATQSLPPASRVHFVRYLSEKFRKYCATLPEKSTAICEAILASHRDNPKRTEKLFLRALGFNHFSVMDKTTCKANLFHELTHHIMDDHLLTAKEGIRRHALYLLGPFTKALGAYCVYSSLISYVNGGPGFLSIDHFVSLSTAWTGMVLLSAATVLCVRIQAAWKKNVFMPQLQMREKRADQAVVTRATDKQLAAFASYHKASAVAHILNAVLSRGCQTKEQIIDLFRSDKTTSPHGNLIKRWKKLRDAVARRKTASAVH